MNSICQPLATEAYQASKEGQSDVKKVAEDIDRLVEPVAGSPTTLGPPTTR
jgi:hypothetical protein